MLTAVDVLGFDVRWSRDGTKIFFDSSRKLDGSDGRAAADRPPLLRITGLALTFSPAAVAAGLQK